MISSINATPQLSTNSISIRTARKVNFVPRHAVKKAPSFSGSRIILKSLKRCVKPIYNLGVNFNIVTCKFNIWTAQRLMASENKYIVEKGGSETSAAAVKMYKNNIALTEARLNVLNAKLK